MDATCNLGKCLDVRTKIFTLKELFDGLPSDSRSTNEHVAVNDLSSAIERWNKVWGHLRNSQARTIRHCR